MDPREARRTWALPLAVLALLPVVAIAVRSCVPPIGDGHPGGAPPGKPADTVTAATCATCHARESSAWATSHHALAERELTASDPGPLRMIGHDGVEASFDPVRAIGVDPLVQFLIEGDRGRLQVGQSAWDPEQRAWFDVFGDGRGPGEWGHWTGAAMTWNAQCVSCHATTVAKGWNEATDSYATTVGALGVTCVACHGAQDAHATGGAPVRLDGDQIESVCASCHARRAELTGRFVPGEDFLDHFAPVLVDTSDAFHPDGQIHQEDFEHVAFLGARMHETGVRCTSCHDPHSGRTWAEGDALCLGCHGLMADFARHDPHREPVACIGCHMPVTTYMQRDARHDHAFRIPDPVLEVAIGSPTACSRCHDEGDAFAVEASARWWGSSARPSRSRATALARAKDGDEDAVPALLGVLRNDPAPAWRAAAAGMAGGFLGRSDVQEALAAAMADPDALVRFAAAGAGEPITPALEDALDSLLRDPVRAVRIAAARALRGRLTPEATLAADYTAYLAHNSDQPSALHERGTWFLGLGRTGRALVDLQRAVQLDPGSPAFHEALAVAFAADGRSADAAAALARAVVLAPEDAEIRYRLALAQAGIGDLAAAEGSLETAVRIAPDHARAWYNLGLVRAKVGRAGAVEAARRAEALDPTNPEVAFAVASVLAAEGRGPEAIVQARRVLTLDSAHVGALGILAGP